MEDSYKPAGTVEAKDRDMEARVKAEQHKFPNLPAKYVGFTVKFKCFWIWINVISLLMSAGMATGSVLILGREHDQKSIAYQECQGMGVVCWALFVLHICNFLFSLLALCGMEKRLCISQVLCALVIFDSIIMVWAQITYFQS